MAPNFHGLRSIEYRTEWGPWYLSDQYCLVNKNNGYWIDLEAIESTADILNWLMHMSAKDDYGDDFLYFLSCAFVDIFRFCGYDTTSNFVVEQGKFRCAYVKAKKVKRYVPSRLRHIVLERDKFRCQDCGASPSTGAVLEVDHTIPVSKGGTNDMSNLRTLCSDCNRGKSDRIVDYS